MRVGLLLCGVLLAAPALVSCGGDDASGDQDAGGDATVSGAKFGAAAEKFENTFKETNTSELPAGLPALRMPRRS